MSTTNFFRIGYTLVVSAWLAVRMTGLPASVGQVLLSTTLTSLVFSKPIGKLVDAIPNKKLLVSLGYAGVTIAGLLPTAALLYFPLQNQFVIVLAVVILTTISSGVVGCSMDYFLKLFIDDHQRLRRLSLLTMCSQIALIAGTGAGGVLISYAGVNTAFLPISVCGVIAMAMCALLPTIDIDGLRKASEASSRASATRITYRQYPALLSAACCGALVLSVGQATNALLPALIDLQLKRSSLSYSLIEIFWSSGSFLVCVLFTSKLKRTAGKTACDAVVILVMSALLAVTPRLSSFGAILALHFLLGIGFSAVRIHAEVRFLNACPTQMLGRYRSNSVILSSLVGLAVFITPTLFTDWSIASLYLAFGGAVAVCSAGIFVLDLRGNIRTRSALNS
ncbi:MAG: MFS transporter [Janthinobacterium lividum]